MFFQIEFRNIIRQSFANDNDQLQEFVTLLPEEQKKSTSETMSGNAFDPEYYILCHILLSVESVCDPYQISAARHSGKTLGSSLVNQNINQEIRCRCQNDGYAKADKV